MRTLWLGTFCAWIAFAGTAGLEQADQLRRAKKYNEAIAAYRQAIARTPDSEEARYGLVRSLIGAGSAEEARKQAADDLARSPNSAMAHLESADAAFRAADFAGAEKLYNTALQLDPKLARAWLGMGQVFAMVSRFRTAGEYFTKAFELDADDPEIMQGYVASQRRGGKRRELLARYREVVSDDPEARRAAQVSVALDRALADHPPFDLKSPYQSTVLKLDFIRPNPKMKSGWSLPVSFNGDRPRTLLLDTGAGGVSISHRYAEKLGLKPLADTAIRGIGDKGELPSYVTIVDSIRIGDVVFENCPITVSERAVTSNSEGLIGTDVFSKFLVTIDGPEATLELTALPAKPGPELQDAAPVPPAPGLVHFFRFGHLMLIPTLVNKEPVSMFVVDTGAWMPVVSTSLARRIGKPGKSSMFGVRGASGTVEQVYEAHAVTLAFAGFASRQNLMLSFDFSRMNDETGTETSGLLGMPMLEVFRFTIDYQNGTIRFEHRPRPRIGQP